MTLLKRERERDEGEEEEEGSKRREGTKALKGFGSQKQPKETKFHCVHVKIIVFCFSFLVHALQRYKI